MMKSYCAISQYDETIIEIPTKNLISYNFGLLDRGDDKDTISWGIYSNTGNLSFILPQSASGYFKNDVDFRSYKVIFSTEDTENDSMRSRLGTFYINDFNYNEHTKVVELELTDRLQEWQDVIITINIPSMLPVDKDAVSLKSIHDTVLSQNKNMPLVGFDYGVEKVLSSTQISYNYCEKTISFWDYMEEICSLIGGRVSINEAGTPMLSLGQKQQTVDIKSNYILSIEPIGAKRHNSISSAKIKVPNQIELKSLASIENSALFEISQPYEHTKEIVIRYEYNKNNKFHVNNRIKLSYEYANITKADNDKIRPNNFSFDFKPLGTDDIMSLHDQSISGIVDIAMDGNYVTRLTAYFSESFYNFVKDEFGYMDATQLRYLLSNYQIYGNVVTSGEYSIFQKFNTQNGKELNISVSPWGLWDEKFSRNPSILNKIVERIENICSGRTCITLSCVLGDFYYGKDFVIPKHRTIRKYDVVIPYIKKKGVQVPYMGTVDKPMQFLVIGVEYSYKGHFVETLHLQEYVE